MTKIDKLKIAEGYIEMGELNLSICNEFYQAEQSASITYENELKKQYKGDSKSWNNSRLK
jgi:hypothetical protein